LPDVEFSGLQEDRLGNLLGVAVTKTPATPGDFRGYLLGINSNLVTVFDYKLEVLGTFQPTPPIVTTRDFNLAAIGVAIAKVDGEDLLAVLDPDGPNNNDLAPRASFYHLSGPEAGQLLSQIDIDTSQVSPRPFLYDWDFGPDGNFVAGGESLTTNDFVIVRIAFDPSQHTLIATDVVPSPQRDLTPLKADRVVGVGVSVLPSGNLLIGGSDTSC
jgi:hypothetical protein